MSKLPQFNVGDIVAYASPIANCLPALARRRGVIADFEGNRDWTLAIVEWSGGTLSRVHVNNLAKPGANSRFCSV